MDYEWDPQKAAANGRKHGIEFSDAVAVFADPHAVTIESSSSEEERFVALGMDALGRLLAVAFAIRGERTRMISARKATPSERDHYSQKSR